MKHLEGTRRGLLAAAVGLVAVVLLGAQAPKAAPEGAAPEKVARVLFVGNSYTYANDLPKLVQELAAADRGAPRVETEMVAPGGTTLEQHCTTTGALAKVREGKFTHVVIQGQSLETLTQPEKFQKHAKELADAAREAGSKVVFYQTWARRADAKEYAEKWSTGAPKSMQIAISEAYAKAASSGRGELARVGDAWRGLIESKDPPPLFDEDGSHPSIAGTYLAGCVIYEAISARDCTKIELAREGLDSKLAARLRKAAHSVR